MKPGKGQALYRCKLKNMLTGVTMDRTWRANDRFEKADLGERSVVYLYSDGKNYIFSDNETYEELTVSEAVLGNQVHFLVENAPCTILFYNNEPMEVALPIFIEKEVVQTEPAVRGDTATNVTKPATLDNGYAIQVPLFINQGDSIKIDTRIGEYVERLKKGGA